MINPGLLPVVRRDWEPKEDLQGNLDWIFEHARNSDWVWVNARNSMQRSEMEIRLITDSGTLLRISRRSDEDSSGSSAITYFTECAWKGPREIGSFDVRDFRTYEHHDELLIHYALTAGPKPILYSKVFHRGGAPVHPDKIGADPEKVIESFLRCLGEARTRLVEE